ncbi:outer membrane lipoprotein carrier protein LolA [Actinoplanes sp. TFC3]|uniref:LolA family protein n=1 Tax=Actinoplanes sp. TFC3 TaxID=1710355 RepID=UPI00082B1C06|nr:outer membrane lipoprotein carrier protein LolA [Actinoplanes sp. TFC3]
MSVFKSRPALRWLVPTAAAVVVIGGGAAAGTIVASADPTLEPRSAAQLLVDLQSAKVDGFSGTVVQTADLGLPSLPGVTGGANGAELMNLVAGSNTARVWYAGDDKVRLALMSKLGETDVIRNGSDVWLWRSAQNQAAHYSIPAGRQHERPATTLPQGVPSTPQEAADAALAAIDPTTQVTTTGAAKVAGRDAYELVLQPRDTASLIGQVRLAIDGEKHIPLGVDVYAKDATKPAVRIAFQQISFDTPDAEQFAFKAPPGTEVTEQNSADADKGPISKTPIGKGPLGKGPLGKAPTDKAPEGTKVVGKGWTSVLVAKLPQESAKGSERAQLDAVTGALPEVSGAWGKGRLLQSNLFSALLTDDGRVLVGAVAPEKLYEAAGK